MTLFCISVLLICVYNALLNAQAFTPEQEKLREEDRQMREALFAEYAKFYATPSDTDFYEITSAILASPYVLDAQKNSIRTFGRRTFVFSYPSDGLKVKGLISFTPEANQKPLLFFLRGGTENWGIINPGADYMCPENYSIIATLYRGGVSQGKDEFGGEDVDDVKNLIEYIPVLENKLAAKFQSEKMFLIGGSRGGMQMFLALTRFPELQQRFRKIVSLSGILDMRQCIMSRSDMRQMFTNQFGFQEGVNDEEWINKRDPLLIAAQISSDLPILIIQGTADLRVSLLEGYRMVERLEDAGKQVSYLEIEGAEHCLSNLDNRMKIILDLLEQ